MKTLALFLVIFSIYFNAKAQLPANFNLVPNPSFEHNRFSFLDTSFANSKLCWIKANGIASAIYHENPTPVYNPLNLIAKTGKSFGVVTVQDVFGVYKPNVGFSDTENVARSYYQTKLLEPLLPNTRYYYSMNVASYKHSNWTNNFVIANIGAYFSNSQIRDYNNRGRLNLTPQVNFPSWQLNTFDTFYYQKLSGNFIATGGELFLTIGNFDYFTKMNFAALSPNTTFFGIISDIWIDDIVVVKDTLQPTISLTEFSLGNDTVTLCYDQTLTIGGQPDFFHYWWNTGDTTRFINITQPGTYWCTVDFGCNTYADTITVIAINDTSKPLTPLPDIYICNTNGTFVTADSGYISYLWNTGQTSATILVSTPGLYTLEVLDNCGAIYRDTFEAFDAVTEINLGNDTTVCNETMSVQLSIPSSLTHIVWSTGATTTSITITAPGLYYVTAESPCGTLSDTIRVSFCSPVINNIHLSSQTICVGECITIAAQTTNYPQVWHWTFEGATPNTYTGENPPSVCYNNVGDFDITLVASNNGGNDTFTSSVHVLPIPIGRFADTTINVPYKTTLNLKACADAQHVYWYRGDSIVCNDCPVYRFQAKDWKSVYYCVAENADGVCSDTCIYKVSVYDIPSDVYLPTAFSPNGDGKNETFSVLTDNPNFLLYSLSVYNRWGQRIYHGTNENVGWDGTFNSKPVEIGVYFWALKYRIKGVDKDFFYKKGDVTVVR